ncbi:MAG: hypothetical protein FD147_2589 [Chloroflexi bacterium]|nr:MAG: hypothetical protein FD147_2589 [Chloroflexota bacterium]
MKYKILIEGQTLDLEEDIAGDDGKLRSALTPYFPGAANAKFMRSEPKEDTITVTVIKQAGTKGLLHADKVIFDEFSELNLGMAESLCKLIASLEGVNPVAKMNEEMAGRTLNQLDAEQLLRVDDQIEDALTKGRKENDNLRATANLLIEADAQPSSVVVTGF